MLRTRILSFAAGFATSAAAFSFFVYMDLWTDRLTLSSELSKFGELETRIATLEQSRSGDSNALQVEYNHKSPYAQPDKAYKKM